MVRFSCFHTHSHCHKSKKTVQHPYKAMHKTFQDSIKDPALDISSTPISLDPFLLKAHGDNPSNTSAEKVTSSSSVENCWKSEEMSSNFSPEGNVEVHQTICLKKSQSLGSGLDMEGFVSSGIDIEDEVDKGFSCGDSHEKYCGGIFDSKNPEMILPNQYPEVLVLESFQEKFSDGGNPETNFSNRDLVQLQEEGHEKYATQSYGEHANGSDHHSPGTSPMITKSCSWPNMGASEPTSEEDSPFHVLIGPRHASCEDLAVLDGDKKEFLNHDFEFHGLADEDRDNMIFKSDKDKCENSSGDGHDSFNLAGLTKEWTIKETYGIGAVKNLQGESSAHTWDELPNKEFKIKRIEEWVSSIDLQDNTPSEQISESSYPTEVKRVSNSLGGVTIAKFNAKTTPGTEAANNYISSLTATSTSAQLINLGLVSIPFLSAFVNLRALNLSGNAIVKITAGALPRGLHMLNLSKNNISSIEGLRELTRLRVLDLSFNRIFRIGHGLASCPSLKELYLAGNKISEIEGLHRLLKLNVLDLRFNKISTAKCLGQLAANYASLQAISLEGNPAQRNVGDEQLKKYLQGILPYLVSFNKQPIKATSSSKEVSDRTTRSAATVHQFDRGSRSENKVARKGSHSLTPQKVSSSGHGSTSRAVNSPKQSKGQHVHLPPSGTKETNHHHHHHPLDLRGKLLGWSNLSMRRSQSEGTLGTS